MKINEKRQIIFIGQSSVREDIPKTKTARDYSYLVMFFTGSIVLPLSIFIVLRD